jgi:hypothetical protein
MNERFNNELEAQINGNLPKGHIYQLGRPGDILRNAGIPDLPIEVNADVLALKASQNYGHPFELSEIKDLPNAIQDPIMVFDSKTRNGSKVILTELQSKSVNFVVAMEMNHKGKYNKNTEINSIRSVYPKNRLLEVISNWCDIGLLRYVNKEKASALTTQLQSNSADVAVKAEAYMYNIVKNFGKSKGKGEKM